MNISVLELNFQDVQEVYQKISLLVDAKMSDYN